jgi:hypothetical protein
MLFYFHFFDEIFLEFLDLLSELFLIQNLIGLIIGWEIDELFVWKKKMED